MSAIEFSKAVADATRFLTSVHDDVRGLVVALDELMSKAGWVSAFKNQVSWELGNGLRDKAWVMPYLFRLYLPTAEPTAASRAILAVVNLEPPEGAPQDYAALVVAAFRFATPQDATAIYDKWNASEPAYHAALGAAVPVTLTLEQCRTFISSATAACAVALPLGEVSDATTLANVVNPLIEAEKKLGAHS